jgi:four helix bundle protein
LDYARRAAVSVPSNVAEGQASGLGRRYLNHVRIALGSLAELETQAEIARRLGFLSASDLSGTENELTRARQLLHGLSRSIRRELLNRIASPEFGER